MIFKKLVMRIPVLLILVLSCSSSFDEIKYEDEKNNSSIIVYNDVNIEFKFIYLYNTAYDYTHDIKPYIGTLKSTIDISGTPPIEIEKMDITIQDINGTVIEPVAYSDACLPVILE
jgi:hypothetical protein